MSIDIINLRVEDAIAEYVEVGTDGWFDAEGAAEAAITAAEPHLRRKHRQELYQELHNEGYADDRDWMSSRAEKEGLTLE